MDFHGILCVVIQRAADIALVRAALRRSRVVALVGPRQCGKTTLARQFVAPDSLNYFDLEDPASLARLSEPEIALRPLRKLVVIDEVQRRPDLFPLLRVLVDRKPLPARFLILGSASPDLLRQSSETLAGTAGDRSAGGLPALRSGSLRQEAVTGFAADSPWPTRLARKPDSLAWRQQFLQTFLERDMPATGDHDSRSFLAAILDDGGALSRANLERRRTGPRHGRRGSHGAPLPGPDDGSVHGPPTAAVV